MFSLEFNGLPVYQVDQADHAGRPTKFFNFLQKQTLCCSRDVLDSQMSQIEHCFNKTMKENY